jgi:hypothetical protein
MKNQLQRIGLILLIGIGFCNMDAFAQDSTLVKTDSAVVMLSTNSGEQFVGTIISEDPREVTIRLQTGKLLTIPTYTIKSIKPVLKENIIGGKVVYSNPHPSRYFYTPSALAMDKGEVYIQTVYGFVYQAQFGITDQFSVGATTTLVGTPLALTAKLSLPVDEKNTFAIGTLAGIVGWGTKTSLGIGFGAFTHGTKESNITLAGGYGWYTDRNNKEQNPNGTQVDPVRNTKGTGIFSLCGNQRLSKNLSLMGEFWFIPEGNVFFGGPCMRLYNNRKSSFDFGLWTVKIKTENTNKYPVFPVFSYTFKFDK